VKFAHIASAKKALKLNGFSVDCRNIKVSWKYPSHDNNHSIDEVTHSPEEEDTDISDLIADKQVRREKNLQSLVKNYQHLFPVGSSSSTVS